MNMTSLSVAIESSTPPVINGVVSVSSEGSSPGRNSLRIRSLTTALMSSVMHKPFTGRSVWRRLAAGTENVRLLLQLIVKPRCYQLMAAPIGVFIPLRETEHHDILAPVHPGQVENGKTRAVGDPQYFRGFVLPRV